MRNRQVSTVTEKGTEKCAEKGAEILANKVEISSFLEEFDEHMKQLRRLFEIIEPKQRQVLISNKEQ